MYNSSKYNSIKYNSKRQTTPTPIKITASVVATKRVLPKTKKFNYVFSRFKVVGYKKRYVSTILPIIGIKDNRIYYNAKFVALKKNRVELSRVKCVGVKQNNKHKILDVQKSCIKNKSVLKNIHAIKKQIKAKQFNISNAQYIRFNKDYSVNRNISYTKSVYFQTKSNVVKKINNDYVGVGYTSNDCEIIKDVRKKADRKKYLLYALMDVD